MKQKENETKAYEKKIKQLEKEIKHNETLIEDNEAVNKQLEETNQKKDDLIWKWRNEIAKIKYADLKFGDYIAMVDWGYCAPDYIYIVRVTGVNNENIEVLLNEEKDGSFIETTQYREILRISNKDEYDKCKALNADEFIDWYRKKYDELSVGCEKHE